MIIIYNILNVYAHMFHRSIVNFHQMSSLVVTRGGSQCFVNECAKGSFS